MKTFLLTTTLLFPLATTLAQEVKRAERMEAAVGADGETRPSAGHADSPIFPGVNADGQIVLHNQWSLNPAGNHLEVGDFPVNIAMRPAGKVAAVIHCGQGTHEVMTVRMSDRSIISRVTIPQGFSGLCFSPDGKFLYASGGEFDLVHRWAVDDDGLLYDQTPIKIVDAKESFVVAGLATNSDGSRLYVCGPWGSKLAIVDTANVDANPQMVSFPPDTFPYTVTPSPDNTRLYVSLWGGSAVAVVNPESLSIEQTWSTPSHPTESRLTKDGKTLFVACANSNQVAIIDTASGRTLELVSSALYPVAPTGSTPNSIALSADDNILVVANADNNNIALFNVSEPGESKSLGFIPTGWHPTSVRIDSSGDILVANGKGLSPRTNRHGPQPGGLARNVREYIGSLHKGAISWIKFPDAAQLAKHTADAYKCSPLREDLGVVRQAREEGNPIPNKLGESSPIKHCIYIIKENRTYDQVFGDMKEGRGDPSICIFGEEVTPNHHALAREFVLLDNFYVEGEVSADGHEWSMGAYATDFVERCWPISYRKQPKNSEIGYPSEGARDIAVPAGGYIWDRCKEAGVTYRSYGEFIENGPKIGDPGKARSPNLEGNFDPYYRGYDLNVSDLDRVARFKEELAGFESTGVMPQLMIVRLPNDHTAGTRVGALTPTAMVAQNDLALGQFVEAIAKSRFWKETAIFVVEDDAQNGPDHIDAHRTVALVISPWTKRKVVDSSLYSTSSMLRTMELILGLQPMSQFDAAALPMYASFSPTPDLTPYVARPARVDIEARNVATAWGAELSAEMDLAVEDAADDILFNEIIWKSVRGADSPMPPPVRAAFVFVEAEEGE
jgi:DNA-binding beta-propeller fold protein YncE